MNLWRSILDQGGYTATKGIVGVDPGGTTGIFSVIVSENAEGDTGTLTSWTQVTRDAEVTIGYMLLTMKECGIPANRLNVAIEKYIITQRTAKLTRQPAALEVTGEIKALARRHDARVWEFTASNAKKFASDELLERVGWIGRGRSQRHARDAARQTWSCLAEVDFPAWEATWENQAWTVDGDEVIEVSMDEIMRAGGMDDDLD